MPASLEDLKLDLRIDNDYDDSLLQRYLNAAETYVKRAICDTNDAGTNAFFNQDSVDDLYSTAVLARAATYYTYRTSLNSSHVSPVNEVEDAIIGQLRGEFNLWKDKQNGQSKYQSSQPKN